MAKKVDTCKGHVEFWMCYVNGSTVNACGSPPTYKHYHYDEARVEAERLARKTGRDVIMLKAVEFVRIAEPQPPATWHDMYPEGTF